MKFLFYYLHTASGNRRYFGLKQSVTHSDFYFQDVYKSSRDNTNGFVGNSLLGFNFCIIEIERNLPLKNGNFANLPGSYWF
jgi:hypothetical protein